MSTRPRSVTPVQACVELAHIFQDPLLEEPQLARTAAARNQQHQLAAKAHQACAGCPLAANCLYTAVAEHDVAGYVAGTTARQRKQIRLELGLVVQPEDLESFAGSMGPKRQIDPYEVLRQRAQNPHESLESIARRLGCSLSTVKRHLRRARHDELPAPVERRPQPTMAEVLHAAARVMGPSRVLEAARASDWERAA